jgi:hypothetical protein
LRALPGIGISSQVSAFLARPFLFPCLLFARIFNDFELIEPFCQPSGDED